MEKKLPNGWAYVDIGELAEIVTGGTPKKSVAGNYGGVVPFYKPKDLDQGASIESTQDTLTKQGLSKSRALPPNSILVTCIGATIGKTGFIRREGASNQQINSIIPNKYFDSKYAYYQVIGHEFQRSIISSSSSTTLPILNKSKFSALPFKLAPLPEQKRIAAKLDELFGHLDALKTKLDRIPELIKNFRQQVLTQAFTGKLTEEWRKGKDLGEWEERTIDDLIEGIDAGKSFSAPEIPVTEGRVGLVKISAVTWGEFNPMETKTVEDESQINPDYFIMQGDFLMSRANTLELVGSPVIVRKLNLKIMLSDKVWRVRFKNSTTKELIHFYLKSKLGRKSIESRATGNQLSMRNLSQKNFKSIDLLLPPLQEQKEIVKRVEGLLAVADKIEAQYNSLKTKIDTLPQAILNKAFKGELVPQNPNDEPASVLLERIKDAKPGSKKGAKAYKEKETEVPLAAESKEEYK